MAQRPRALLLVHDPAVKTLHDVSHLVGWQALATYLSGLGITVTWTALETRGRRYGLPSRGRGVRGREVLFNRSDIDAWVEHLTGLRLDAWIAKRTAATGAAGRVAPRPRRRVDRDRHLLSVLAFPTPLYALTVMTPASGEQVVRRGAAVLASPSTEPLADFDPDVLGGTEVGYWRYDVARISTPADLHAPRLSAPQRKTRAAARLVGALVPGVREWRWCRVPARFFDGADAVGEVPFLAADGLADYAAAVAAVRAAHRDAVFVTWTRRVSVTPVVFEPLCTLSIDLDSVVEGREIV